ncbi:hypothetical protein XthCFBP4691_08130 [Xanthomonas theicola]|uniref:Uncharacterized protein n=1 Tax=Xanthomonas theicola TaxID=56464 RepID=A0A2S6ZGD3_9XANT|nr:hypothetical protein XthCFBP4691_08130 [Xanthomonas theicola]
MPGAALLPARAAMAGRAHAHARRRRRPRRRTMRRIVPMPVAPNHATMAAAAQRAGRAAGRP